MGGRRLWCERVVRTVTLTGYVPVQVPCAGVVRRLYVREVRKGKAAGWRAVGTVCLKCRDLHLDEERLPSNS